MKKITQVILVTFILFSYGCQKEDSMSIKEFEYKEAFNQINSIVKGKGNIFKLNSVRNLNNITSNDLRLDSIEKLNIEQFKAVFMLLNTPTSSVAIAKIENPKDSLQIKASSFKKLDEYDSYDSLRPAGTYRADFTLFPSQFYNFNTGGFYNLHISFQTNSLGAVIGDPKVYLTGIGLSGWQQMSVSGISFNKALATSTFIVHGVTTFGISFSNGGGMTLGFTMERDYLFNISMESFFQNKAVYVEQN